MEDRDILTRVRALVDEERTLRDRRQRGQITSDDEHARLRDLEAELDQCWDLLRARRAREEAGLDPDEVAPRSEDEVEDYLQ